MKNIKVVLGLNYGDEGKGLMTDFFCRSFPKDEPVINVRFNGGAQAGHTVVSKFGDRHVFSHFGAGSFNYNTKTLLDENFILNPILFVKEYNALKEIGNIDLRPYVHRNCFITLPMDMMVNQFLEKARDSGRHGSCGIGIYETIERNKHQSLRTTIEYFANLTAEEIVDKILHHEKLWEYYESRFMSEYVHLNPIDAAIFRNKNILMSFANDLIFMCNNVEWFSKRESILTESDNFVFEGAQGLLLDMDKDTIHSTPSHTGLQYTLPWFDNKYGNDIEVCYVTRTYATRHGAGSFREIHKEYINPNMVDRTNIPNPFQGTMRYGSISYDSVKREIYKQKEIANGIKNSSVMHGVAGTHMNETNGKFVGCIHLEHRITPAKFSELVGCSVNYVSWDEREVKMP